MKFLRAFFMRLFGVFGSTKSERELSAEIESHLQLHIDDNIRAGMTPAEARRRAVIALGGVEGTKEAYRDRRGLPAFESLVRDVRYGVRTLKKKRASFWVWLSAVNTSNAKPLPVAISTPVDSCRTELVTSPVATKTLPLQAVPEKLFSHRFPSASAAAT